MEPAFLVSVVLMLAVSDARWVLPVRAMEGYKLGLSDFEKAWASILVIHPTRAMEELPVCRKEDERLGLLEEPR